MRGKTVPGIGRLAWFVIAHLLISLAHGRAHEGAHVTMSTAANAFVVVVILVGPLAGVILARWRPAPGAWLVAVTMAASLLFGLWNHFVIDSADHVARVAAEWRPLFGSTAVLLGLTEGLAAVLATRLALIAGRHDPAVPLVIRS